MLPTQFKNAIYYFKDEDTYEISRFKSKKLFGGKTFLDKRYFSNDLFSTINIESDKIIDYTYLFKDNPFYFDSYQCSIKQMFCIRKPLVPSHFLSETFLKDTSDNHLILYKDYNKFIQNVKTPIYMNSENDRYKFKLGSINIIKGHLVINNLDDLLNFTYLLDGYCYIPSYQELRVDLIDKILNKKIDSSNINEYIENTFCNKSYQDININRMYNNIKFIPINTETDKYIGFGQNSPIENLFDFDIKLCSHITDIDLEESDTYDIIAKKLESLKGIELSISITYKKTNNLLIACFMKNSVFNIFSI